MTKEFENNSFTSSTVPDFANYLMLHHNGGMPHMYTLYGHHGIMRTHARVHSYTHIVNSAAVHSGALAGVEWAPGPLHHT